MRSRFFTINAIIAVIFLSLGVTLAFDFSALEESNKANSINDIDKMLDQEGGYELLEEQFIWGDPEENVELRRYALKQLVDGGGSGYGVTLSHRAAADPDLQCRQLYVEMLN